MSSHMESIYQSFHNYITSYTQVCEKDFEMIKFYFYKSIYHKGQFFKQANTICNQLGFVPKGSFRHYLINEAGLEITPKLTNAPDMICEFISYSSREPNPASVVFLEPAEALIISKDKEEELLNKNLTYSNFRRKIMEAKVVELGKYYVTFLTGNASDRYKFILKNYPEALKIAPLQHIASLIGVTPTQLSRIRKNFEF